MERQVTLEKHNMTVTVKELTVAEMRDWLKGVVDGGKIDLLNAGLFEPEGVSIDEVLMMTSLEPGELDSLTPVEVVKVIDKCREVNPHFFRFRAATIEIGRPATPTSSDNS